MTQTPPFFDPDALLDERQVARILRTSVRTLQSWRPQEAGPPYTRIRRMIRYRRQDLTNWIALFSSSGRASDAAR